MAAGQLLGRGCFVRGEGATGDGANPGLHPGGGWVMIRIPRQFRRPGNAITAYYNSHCGLCPRQAALRILVENDGDEISILAVRG